MPVEELIFISSYHPVSFIKTVTTCQQEVEKKHNERNWYWSNILKENSSSIFFWIAIFGT